MGVRGKIEAVIYAAEEPVTLAQLAGLFGEEALGEGAPIEPAEAALEEASGEQLDESEAAHIAAGAEPGRAQETPNEPDTGRRDARLRDRKAREAIRSVLAELTAEYDASDRGMEIREIAGGYRIATKPEYHDAVRVFAKCLKPPMKLSLPALETLAVIAYKQPVTAPEISEIRGVDSGGVLGSLISRKLVTTAGRKQVVGRPILYKTTKEFLLRFGLKDLNELPSMEEFEKMAGELQAIGEEPNAPENLAGRLPAVLDEAFGPDRGGERPHLAPASIDLSVEEPEAPGVSINRSGMPVRDSGSEETGEGN